MQIHAQLDERLMPCWNDSPHAELLPVLSIFRQAHFIPQSDLTLPTTSDPFILIAPTIPTIPTNIGKHNV